MNQYSSSPISSSSAVFWQTPLSSISNSSTSYGHQVNNKELNHHHHHHQEQQHHQPSSSSSASALSLSPPLVIGSQNNLKSECSSEHVDTTTKSVIEQNSCQKSQILNKTEELQNQFFNEQESVDTVNCVTETSYSQHTTLATHQFVCRGSPRLSSPSLSDEALRSSISLLRCERDATEAQLQLLRDFVRELDNEQSRLLTVNHELHADLRHTQNKVALLTQYRSGNAECSDDDDDDDDEKSSKALQAVEQSMNRIASGRVYSCEAQIVQLQSELQSVASEYRVEQVRFASVENSWQLEAHRLREEIEELTILHKGKQRQLELAQAQSKHEALAITQTTQQTRLQTNQLNQQCSKLQEALHSMKMAFQKQMNRSLTLEESLQIAKQRIIIQDENTRSLSSQLKESCEAKEALSLQVQQLLRSDSVLSRQEITRQSQTISERHQQEIEQYNDIIQQLNIKIQHLSTNTSINCTHDGDDDDDDEEEEVHYSSETVKLKVNKSNDSSSRKVDKSNHSFIQALMQECKELRDANSRLLKSHEIRLRHKARPISSSTYASAESDCYRKDNIEFAVDDINDDGDDDDDDKNDDKDDDEDEDDDVISSIRCSPHQSCSTHNHCTMTNTSTIDTSTIYD